MTAKVFVPLFVAAICVAPAISNAGICDTAWDGDKVAKAITGRPAHLRVPLRDKSKNTTEVSVEQIQAFHEAKDRISRVAGLSPTFLICSSNDPNAFATAGKNGDVIGVTIGMLKLANGDRDMAAAVMGHEVAHHTQRHRALADARDAAIGIASLIAGIVLETKLQQRHPQTSAPGLGLDLAQLGGSLVGRKFDRDQEREADTVGFKYMVDAAFNPNGSVALAERMNRSGLGGVGLFFDSHPGWPERSERFRALIAADPEAQRLASIGSSAAVTASSRVPVSAAMLELEPTYTTTDAQKSYSDGMAAWRTKNIAIAVREFRSAAEAGYAPAQAMVGWLHSTGQGGLRKDDVEAVRLYKLAADQGDALGQGNLGFMLSIGRGIAKDDVEAVRLFRLSSDQGNPIGQLNLGFFYSTGRGGLQKDANEAVRLYRLAADQGNPVARTNLGLAYVNGIGGLEKDEKEAIRLFGLAAHQGHAAAQANLGFAYSQGRGGLQKDEYEAVRLYRLAADQGYALAQANLGYMYQSGRGGLTKDPSEAVRLYRLSAAQGNTQGLNNLGAAYENGNGVPKDIEEAVSWYQKAAAQGHGIAIANLKRLGRM